MTGVALRILVVGVLRSITLLTEQTAKPVMNDKNTLYVYVVVKRMQ